MVNHVLRAGVLGDLPVRDFVVSPGFAGTAALLAAIIASCAVLYGVRKAGWRSQQLLEQREHELARAREDAERAQAAARCWKRWQWVVETAGMEPAVSEGATLGLGPAVTLELLRGLLGDAEQLGDQTLARVVAVHQEQLLLVLAQQGGPVSELAGVTTVQSPVGKLDDEPASSARLKSATEPTTTAGDTPSATVGEVPSAAVPGSGSGRRRR